VTRRRPILKKYGLEQAAGYDQSQRRERSRDAARMVGKAEANTLYARDAAKAGGVTVDSALLDDFKKGADDYRRKDIFRVPPVQRHAHRAHAATARRRARPCEGRARPPDKWQPRQPEPGDVDKEKSDILLSKLSTCAPRHSWRVPTAKPDSTSPRSPWSEVRRRQKEERVTSEKSTNDVFVPRNPRRRRKADVTFDFNY